MKSDKLLVLSRKLVEKLEKAEKQNISKKKRLLMKAKEIVEKLDTFRQMKKMIP